MKKTFPVNINSKVFYIDEDAYTLLDDYLTQLRVTFTGEEGEEIVSDIEQRISEHFDARLTSGKSVVILDDVNRVIEIMGKPEQLTDDIPASHKEADREDSACDGDEPPAIPHASSGKMATPPPIRRRIYRDERHKVFGGVIAGLAQYLGWDATIMRILVVILALATHVWPCCIVYLVAWMIIPVARTPRQILEMQGQPVTIDNVGQTVIYNASVDAGASVPGSNRSAFFSFINTFFSIAAKVIIGFVCIGMAVCAFVMLCFILYILAVLVLAAFGMMSSSVIIDTLDFTDTSTPMIEIWFLVSVLTAVIFPTTLIAWYGGMVLFKLKAPTKNVLLTLLILEVIIIVTACVLGSLNNSDTLAAILPDSTPLLAVLPGMTLLAPSFSA